ncbi:MAG: hypothetical protein WCD18_00575 [Thermosynechococcaceae cyanobacterium]
MTELQPLIYQAIGIVEGIFDSADSKPTLTVNETVFPVAIAGYARKKLKPLQSQCFRVYPALRNGHLAFKIVAVLDAPPANFKLRGCWEIYQDLPFLVIYRNTIHALSDRNLRSLVSVVWENAPPPDWKFWELEAELLGDQLHVVKAEGPFEPPPKASRFEQPQPKPKETVPEQTVAKPPQALPVHPAAPSLTIQEIRAMATPAKIQLTCKLNQVPAHRELPDKQIEFFLNDGSDRIFTVHMKPKMFKKLTDHGFENWVAAISGELGPVTETGFELVTPSVQVFEKKASSDAGAVNEAAPPKDSKSPSEKVAASATARPQPPKAEAQKAEAKTPADKRKSLLQGVRLS